jgi:hypothetical protein
MSPRGERTSPVTLALLRRIPHGSAWLFHWAATDGDFLPPDGEHRRLHPGERPMGVAVTGKYRDRILEEAGIGLRWWNKSAERWTEAGIAHRCHGYRSIFLFVYDDYACRRCGEVPSQELSVPNSGNSQFLETGTLSSRFEPKTQAATKGAREVQL